MKQRRVEIIPSAWCGANVARPVWNNYFSWQAQCFVHAGDAGKLLVWQVKATLGAGECRCAIWIGDSTATLRNCLAGLSSRSSLLCTGCWCNKVCEAATARPQTSLASGIRNNFGLVGSCNFATQCGEFGWAGPPNSRFTK